MDGDSGALPFHQALSRLNPDGISPLLPHNTLFAGHASSPSPKGPPIDALGIDTIVDTTLD